MRRLWKGLIMLGAMSSAVASEVSYVLQRDACPAYQCKMSLVRMQQGKPEAHARVDWRVPGLPGEPAWSTFRLTAAVEAQTAPPAQWLLAQDGQHAVKIGLQTWPGQHGGALLTLRFLGAPAKTVVQWYDGPPGVLDLQGQLEVSDEADRAYWVEVQPRRHRDGQWSLVQARFSRPHGQPVWQDLALWEWHPQHAELWQPIADAGWGVVWAERAAASASAEGMLVEGRLLHAAAAGPQYLRWAADAEAARRLQAQLQALMPAVTLQRMPLLQGTAKGAGSY
ncbi:hypothetical protein [Leeia sp.]|uniref:hypothetical protein n=1 Tax=Leeia sp. TaxID=2884678 RepID=UPI0035AF62A5